MAQLISASAEYQPKYDGNVGPHRDASGRFNVIVKNDGGRDEIYAYRSPAGGPLSGTWGANSEGNGTTNFEIMCVDTVRVGTTVHVAYIARSIVANEQWILRYATYTLGTTPAWSLGELIDDHSTSGTLSTETYTPWPTCRIDVRSDGDVLVAYQGAFEAVKGTDRNRVKYARREGGTWTANLALDDGGDVDYDHPRCGTMTGTDNFYVTYTNRGTAGSEGSSASSRDEKYVNSSNTVNTGASWSGYGPSDCVAIDSNELFVTFHNSGDFDLDGREIDATPSASTSRLSSLTFDTFSGWDAAGIAWDGSKLHIIVKEDAATDTRRYITWERTNVWTDVQEEAADETGNRGYSVVYNGDDGKLGYIYATAESGGDAYYEEIVLATYEDLTVAAAASATNDGTGKDLDVVTPVYAGSATNTGTGKNVENLQPAFSASATNAGAGLGYEVLAPAFAALATNTGAAGVYTILTAAGTEAGTGSGVGLARTLLTAAYAGAATGTGNGKALELLTAAFAASATNTGAGSPFEVVTPAFSGAGTGTGNGTAFEVLVAAFSALATGTATGLALDVLAVAFAAAANNTGTGDAGITYEDLIVAYAASAAGTGSGSPFAVVAPSFSGAATGTAAGILGLVIAFAAAANNTGTALMHELITAAFAGAGTGDAAGTGLEAIAPAFAAAANNTGSGVGLELLTVAFNGIASNIGFEDTGFADLLVQFLGLATVSPATAKVIEIVAPEFLGVANNHTPAELLIQLLGSGVNAGEALALTPLATSFSGLATLTGQAKGVEGIVPAFAGSATNTAAALGYTLIVPVFDGAAAGLAGGQDVGVLTIDFNGRAKVWAFGDAPVPVIDFLAKAYGHEFVAKAFRSTFLSNELK